MRRRVSFCLAVPLAFASLAGVALAHRVNIFAFVDGDEIQVECGFGADRKVRNGGIVVTDLVTGEIVREGTTDARGIFRFRPPDELLRSGHGLNIRVHAGEGHQNDWRMTPEALRALAAVPGPDLPTPAIGVGAEELEAIVDRVVRARLAPIDRALAERREAGPELRDVVGGVGWILGLFGLAAYLKRGR